MNASSHVSNQRPETAPVEGWRTASVISTDGTAIGYRQIGDGPGVVLVHGTASSGHNLMQLAEALADSFTVTVPDRRGRGLSGPYGPHDGIQAEVEDLDALMAETKSSESARVESSSSRRR